MDKSIDEVETRDVLVIDNLVKIGAICSLLLKKNILSKEELEEETKELAKELSKQIAASLKQGNIKNSEELV